MMEPENMKFISQPISRRHVEDKEGACCINNQNGEDVQAKPKLRRKVQKSKKKKGNNDVLKTDKLFQNLNAELFCKLMDKLALSIREFNLPSVQLSEVWTEIPFKEKTFKTVIKMRWPEIFDIESFDKKKKNSYKFACLLVCNKLQELGILDHSYELLIPKTKEYPFNVMKAKKDLDTIFQRIRRLFDIQETLAKYVIVHPAEQFNCYTCILTVQYPREIVFKSTAFLPENAERMAASEALLWLGNQGITLKKQLYIDRMIENAKKKEICMAPCLIQLPSTVQDTMQSVFSDIENFISSEYSNEKPSYDDHFESVASQNLICPTEELHSRNQNLLKMNKKSSLLPLDKIQETKSQLPITHRRDDILKLIDENQVIVLSGDTGCGKSTQVPQFILDDNIKRSEEVKCNIIVAEPRCISAISLAIRVATERGEEVGDKVGYHVRLHNSLPQQKGSILFCTTGMMILKLQLNPNLKDVSHIIIDEAHERRIETDFSLILLKDILHINKHIKVIIMSASLNTHFFAQYFNSCPVIHIPGKMHHVDEYFLEDLTKIIPGMNFVEQTEAAVDVDLVVNVIIHIDKTQSEGAVLCFLPGWHDLRAVQTKLLKHKDSNSLFICLIHSKLSHEEQASIFLPPPDGYRKVILATNIAETSITIDDVVYVVNSGLHKCTKLDEKMSIVSLNTEWIAKANVQQRKGRAGRTKAGKCYHLFSRKVFRSMEKYPVAEILRMPLENVILNCKLFYPDKKAEDILLKALQPPSSVSVQFGVKELQALEILDEDENLTPLGKIAGKIFIHPRLSVALVYATFLGCLDAVLTICAILSLEKESFINALENKPLIKRIKQLHDYNSCSDHLTLMNMYNVWITSSSAADATQYLEDNLLDGQTFLYIKQLKELFAGNLCAVGLIPSSDSYSNKSYAFNANNCHHPSILASLTAAFFPNVLKCGKGEIINGKINTNVFSYSTISGNSAHIQKESIISDKVMLPSPWLIFFKALKSEARKKALIMSSSPVPSICLLLFSSGCITINNVTSLDEKVENLICASFDDYEMLRFSCTEKEAHLLLKCREYLKHIFNLYLQSVKKNCKDSQFINFYLTKFMPAISKILDTPQCPVKIKKAFGNNFQTKKL